MPTMLITLGRLMATHGLLLVAIYLAGELGRYALVESIGYVGAYSAVAGALLFPLIMLVRLFALVAMLLVLRDGLRGLAVVAPLPPRGRARRAAFFAAMLGSVLAFAVFYSARGYLQDDFLDYQRRVLEVTTGLVAQEAFLDIETGSDLARGELSFGPVTGAVIVAAFALRWAYGRYRDRLPKTVVLGAIYLEGLWIVWSILLLKDLFAPVGGWISTRQAMVWLGELRSWLAEQVAPVAAVWDAVEHVIGVAGGLVVPPLAWIAIAGVVYGCAIATPAVRLRGRRIDTVREHYSRVPDWLRARLGDLWGQFTGRFRPIVTALSLMWRAGPLLIGASVLLFTAVGALEAFLEFGIVRMIGPQDRIEFWMPLGTLILLIVPLVIEPLRILVVASAYDGIVHRVGAPAEATPPETTAGDEEALAKTGPSSETEGGGGSGSAPAADGSPPPAGLGR